MIPLNFQPSGFKPASFLLAFHGRSRSHFSGLMNFDFNGDEPESSTADPTLREPFWPERRA
jgi:hypothetical protein